MIKLKDILFENEKPLSDEKKTFKSGKLFVMKSPYSNENVPYDHIGFITDDGEIIDMSGHRYDEKGKKAMPPQKYKYEDTEDLFKLPKNKEEAIKKGYYKEIPLPKSVEIPSEVPTCSIDKNKAENCGSFVKIVLSNNGIKTTESNNMIDIATKVGEQSSAGKEAIKTLDRKGRKKVEPKKEKPAKGGNPGGWWNKASKNRKASYVKKHGGPPEGN